MKSSNEVYEVLNTLSIKSELIFHKKQVKLKKKLNKESFYHFKIASTTNFEILLYIL